jgi:hypothetical protein
VPVLELACATRKVALLHDAKGGAARAPIGRGRESECAATPLLPLLRLVGRGSKGGAAVGRCPTEEVQGRGRSPVEKEQGRGPVPGGASSATILAPWQIGL